jgi:hypothetical protein
VKTKMVKINPLNKTIKKQAKKIAAKAAVGLAKKMIKSNPMTKSVYSTVNSVVKASKAKPMGKKPKQVTFEAPTAYGALYNPQSVNIAATSDSMTIKGTETWSVLNGTAGTFVPIISDGYLIGPLQPQNPILAKEASNYQQYRFKKLRFRFSSVQSTGVQGQLYMGMTTDPVDLPPITLDELGVFKIHTRANVWTTFALDVPIRTQDWMYVDNSIQTDAELRQNFLGRFFIGTISLAANAPLGTIECDYEVELRRKTGTPNNITSIGMRIPNSSATFAAGFASSSLLPRPSAWYQFDYTNQTITFLASGKYDFSMTLQSSDDIDVANPLDTAMNTLHKYGGGTAAPTLIEGFDGYQGAAHVNKSFVTITNSYRVGRGDYLDFSGCAALTNMFGALRIDKV